MIHVIWMDYCIKHKYIAHTLFSLLTVFQQHPKVVWGHHKADVVQVLGNRFAINTYNEDICRINKEAKDW